VADLVAVLDDAQAGRVVLFGVSDGGVAAIRFAALHRERTRALALFGAYAHLAEAPDVAQLASTWGSGQTLRAMVGPALDELGEVGGRIERVSATPVAMHARWQAALATDVRGDLAAVRAPTAVLHRRGDRIVPIAAGWVIAEGVPGAQLVEIAGDEHLPFGGDLAPIADALANLVDAPRMTPSPLAVCQVTSDFEPAAVEQLLNGGALADGPFEVDRFVVRRTLGAGGMGTVFLADDPVHGRVALKILRHGDRDMYRRFRREAVAIASLSHPAVVQIYELGLDSRVPYLVMEYVPGGSARELDAVPWRRATALMVCAAEGLGAGHVRGLVHRDVKPANLFLPDRTGDRLKVGDFGIVKLADAATLTQAGAMIGTVGYIAPEQIVGDKVDARADVWALGATFYRLLTGERAFDGSAADILAGTLSDGIRDPREHAPDVPAAVVELVRRMAAREPAARPADGNAVAGELAGLLR
jgi:hypothetical protein